MKTIKVDEELWGHLTLLKLDLRKKRLDQVIWELLIFYNEKKNLKKIVKYWET